MYGSCCRLHDGIARRTFQENGAAGLTAVTLVVLIFIVILNF